MEKGFHNLETVFAQVNLADRLDFFVSNSSKITLNYTGLFPVPDKDNLILKAAELLRKRYKVNKGATIKLEKRIPIGSGLGGGSSDAAATLLALNKLWTLKLEQKELLSLAAELGSDVPFFILGGVAIGRGRGELLQPVKCNMPLHIVLVFPRIESVTRKVYETYD
ncbi:MAG: 4-(cytidine 5'-diphospho)-2-C-methyl-D-erythritol kinase, partial [Planctomycetota bacterium]